MKNPNINEHGQEILDPKPMEIPVGFTRPPTLQEQIQRFVRIEASRLAAKEGLETFEEADDFAVGDDYDPSSPYELEFDPDLGKEVTKTEKQHLDQARQQFDQEIIRRRKGKPPVKKNPKKTEDSESED